MRASTVKSMLYIACGAATLAIGATAFGQIDKGHQLLMNYGLQTQGLVDTNVSFHLDTFQAANYSTVNLSWGGDMSTLGPAPGAPWARWAGDPTQMPGGGETPYLPNLVALQLGDEQNLNDATVRQNTIDWFNNVRAQYPNTILYANNWGTQITDNELNDFINRGRPDMLSFDTYPWQNAYPTNNPAPSPGGSPTGWYSDLRRYRAYAKSYNIPFGIYTQTFHAVQDYNSTSYRNPSPSEQNLNTFGALAYGATYFNSFTYNSGASSLFDPNPQGIWAGDSYPNARYTQQQTINKQARNLGKALVRLKPVADSNMTDGQVTTDGHTTGIQIIRGQHLDGTTTVFNALPSGFNVDSAAQGYSDWEFARNDPYFSGWSTANTFGTKNNGLRGDVIISWFKVLDESLDGPDFSNEVYFMVTNGLTGADGVPSDYRQTITMDFGAPSQGVNYPWTTLSRLNRDTGLVESVPLSLVSGKRRLTLQLDGGTSDLFKFPDGAPFVGIDPVPEPTGAAAVLTIGAVALLRRRRSV